MSSPINDFQPGLVARFHYNDERRARNSTTCPKNFALLLCAFAFLLGLCVILISTQRRKGRRKGAKKQSVRISQRRRPSFRPFKFSAQLHLLTVRSNESELYDVLDFVNNGEHHMLQQSSLRAPGDVEKIELVRLSIRRQLSFKASAISAITIMGREQTIPFHVEHSDLMVWRASSICSRLMQNRGTTGRDTNGDVDRNAHNRTLPRTCQGLQRVKHLLRV